MSNSLSKNWAIAATAIALVLLGIVIGQRTGQVASPSPEVTDTPVTGSVTENAGQPSASTGPMSTEPGGSNEPAVFVIPEVFGSIPSEWRTAHDEGVYDGYAILFDPPRHEVIIEDCFHPGHFNAETGQPVADGWEFCDIVLWGELLSLDENSADVLARNGTRLTLSLSLDNEGGESQLALSFPGHQMTLIPGSKNDLFQAMDQSPEIAEQRRQRLASDLAAGDERRRQLRSNAEETGSDANGD